MLAAEVSEGYADGGNRQKGRRSKRGGTGWIRRDLNLLDAVREWL